MNFLKATIATLALAAAASAQSSFESVASGAEQDLKQAQEELSQLRDRIAEEKIPLSKELTQLEAKVRDLRREAERKQRLADNADVDINVLENKVQARQDQNIYLRNLMSSYTKAFNTRIHEAEMQKYGALIGNAEQVMDRNESTDAEKFAAQVEVLQASIERVEEILGGHRFEGSALGQNLREVRGHFVLAGPVGLFGDGGENVGFAQSEVNAAFPVVRSRGVRPNVIEAINEITQTGSGSIPVDPTEGDAFKIALTKETFVEHTMKGGQTMIFILTLAFAAAVIAIFKFFEINAVKRPKAGDLQEILDKVNAGEKQKALEIANSVEGPFGDLLVSAVEHADQEKELLEEVLYERLLAAQPKLERFLAFIALTAGAAPLLGLLGTVTGMINTFKLITVFGTGDAKALSSGISEALVTTEYGLYVAIPALLAQALLTRLAKGKLGEMEQAAVAFVNGLSKRAS